MVESDRITFEQTRNGESASVGMGGEAGKKRAEYTLRPLHKGCQEGKDVSTCGIKEVKRKAKAPCRMVMMQTWSSIKVVKGTGWARTKQEAIAYRASTHDIKKQGVRDRRPERESLTISLPFG